MSTRVSAPQDLLSMAGATMGTTEWREITQEQVNQFADATGDQQWIHVDVGRAKQGPFGGTIAQGYLTISLVPVFLGEVLTVEHAREVLNYGSNRVRFPAPVPVGSKIRAEITLASAMERGGAVEAVFRVTYEMAGSDRPPCVADVVTLYR